MKLCYQAEILKRNVVPNPIGGSFFGVFGMCILLWAALPIPTLAVAPINDLLLPSNFNVRFDHLGGDNADPGFQSIAVGDLNGDGIPDLIIGVPGASTDGRTGNGAVYIIYGPLASGTGNIVPLNVSSNFNVRLDGAVTSFGYSVAIGDVNGDGKADLVVGAPFENSGLGGVYVIPGPFSSGTGQTKDMAVTTNFSAMYVGDSVATGYGSLPDNMGYSLAIADLDGDGANEIAIGAPNAAITILSGFSKSGKVYVVGGPLVSDMGKSVSMSNAANFKLLALGDGQMGVCVYAGSLINCSTGKETFGAALETGDWNGDGTMDLAVGAPVEHPDGLEQRTSTYVLYGPLPSSTGNIRNMATVTDFNVRYDAPVSDGLGIDLTKGDFNGDGKTDLGIGASSVSGSSSNGAAYLLYNPLPAGTGNVVDLSVWLNFNVLLDGPVGGAVTMMMGQTSLAAADMNNDGKTDVLLGCWGLDALSRTGNGLDFQLPGPFPLTPGAVLISMASSVTTQYAGPVNGAQAGFAIRAGDLNHDGRMDLIIGCPEFPSSAVYVVYQMPPATPTPTVTETGTPTSSPASTATPTMTSTPTVTTTSSLTPTYTVTATWTQTFTPVFTDTSTMTPTPTFSFTSSPSDIFWISKNRHKSGETPVEIRVGPLALGAYSLKVYNSAGELVKDLRDGRGTEGLYDSVMWDGRNARGAAVASGVYLIAYTNGSKTRYGKLVVLR
jgi:glycosylphosphatidylinositol phospholipase D